MKALPDVIGGVAYGMVCGGAYLVAGAGGALIAAGLPWLAFYLWRETSLARLRGRG